MTIKELAKLYTQIYASVAYNRWLAAGYSNKFQALDRLRLQQGPIRYSPLQTFYQEIFEFHIAQAFELEARLQVIADLNDAELAAFDLPNCPVGLLPMVQPDK